jgi:predicted flap endonuclease-1-like 5' DNA nuclease
MAYPIQDIQGIGPSFAEKLAVASIDTTEKLLAHCSAKKGRVELAAKTGVSESLLLKWTNMADMMRVSGIGPQFAELLEASGVDTIKELAQRKAENLATTMAAKNAEKQLTKAVPAASVISGWIQAAKTTESKLTY